MKAKTDDNLHSLVPADGASQASFWDKTQVSCVEGTNLFPFELKIRRPVGYGGVNLASHFDFKLVSGGAVRIATRSLLINNCEKCCEYIRSGSNVRFQFDKLVRMNI